MTLAAPSMALRFSTVSGPPDASTMPLTALALTTISSPAELMVIGSVSGWPASSWISVIEVSTKPVAETLTV